MNREIIWFNGQPVAEIGPPRTPDSDPNSTIFSRHRTLDTGTATNTFYTFTDHLGTPLLQTDTTGAIAWRAEHEPYGNVYLMRKGARTDQPLRFPGQELAMSWEGAEENYNVFRWYRGGWGRYTQADPLGLAPSLNLYSYVNGNPAGLSDPKGLMRIDSSCLDCPCKQRMMKAVSDFNKFFTPGWGDRHPACKAALIAMGSKFTAPDGSTPITCMSNKTRDMVVKCAKGGTGCGGPPNLLSIDFNTVWVQPGSCGGLCGNPVNTLFHEALHNCGRTSALVPDMSRRIIDVFTGAVVCFAASAAAIALVKNLGSSSTYAGGVAQRFGVVAVTCLVIAIATFAFNRSGCRKFEITARGALVAAVLATYECLLFAILVPRIESVALNPGLEVLGEIFAPAFLAGICWMIFLPDRRIVHGVTAFSVAILLCFLGFLVTSPLLARGVTEELGRSRKPSLQHMSGIHTPPFSRHLSYVILSTLAGVAMFGSGYENREPGSERTQPPISS